MIHACMYICFVHGYASAPRFEAVKRQRERARVRASRRASVQKSPLAHTFRTLWQSTARRRFESARECS